MFAYEAKQNVDNCDFGAYFYSNVDNYRDF